MSFANTRRIHRALMNQDLIVAYEHMMTPTAQLADFVLPGDAWLERPSMMAGISAQAMEPPGECRSLVNIWHELAKRMALVEHFPWATAEEVLDWRLEPGGQTWADTVESGRLPKAGSTERKYLETGFATPSGKVELWSSVLNGLGFDPLPYHREAPAPDAEFPMSMFIGLPDDEYYRTGHRHIPELRRRARDPMLFMNPDDAEALGAAEGQWASVITPTGSVNARVYARSALPRGLVRVPHGWWKPESQQGGDVLSGMWDFADAQITPDDDPDHIDREQGIPQMKGLACRVELLPADEVARLEVIFGPTDDLPRGPEGRMLKSQPRPGDFMHDGDFGDGVEFEALELSLYARSSG